jgi:hypothetical protein
VAGCPAFPPPVPRSRSGGGDDGDGEEGGKEDVDDVKVSNEPDIVRDKGGGGVTLTFNSSRILHTYNGAGLVCKREGDSLSAAA